jgi:general secretion pathway protein A
MTEVNEVKDEKKVKKLPAYLRYWGLKKYPFALAPDPSMFYMSRQHQECLVRLKFAVVSGKGGALLISENAGDGKTTLLNKFMQTIKEDVGSEVKIAFLDHPTLTINEMLGEIAKQFGVEDFDISDKVGILARMKAKLIKLKEEGYKCIVVIDEGQMLAHSPEILQELRILMNLVKNGEFLISFILSGQKPLEPAIRNMPEFWQRLPVRFFLRNLDYKDTKNLIKHRIKEAGGDAESIFTETAYKGIYNFSEGCPRVILSIADLSLVIGHSMYSKRIDFNEISQASGDMNKGGESYHYFNYLNDERVDAMEQKKKKCPYCESMIDQGLQYCPNCNFLVEVTGRTKKIKCIHCGVLNTPGAINCSFCGKILMIECPFCGAHNPPARKECGACGYGMSIEVKEDTLTKFKENLSHSKLKPYIDSVEFVRDRFVKEEPLLSVQMKRVFLTSLPNVRVFQGSMKSKSFGCIFTVTSQGLSFTGKKDSHYIPFSEIAKIERTAEKKSKFLVIEKNKDRKTIFDLPLENDEKSILTMALNKYISGFKKSE